MARDYWVTKLGAFYCTVMPYHDIIISYHAGNSYDWTKHVCLMKAISQQCLEGIPSSLAQMYLNSRAEWLKLDGWYMNVTVTSQNPPFAIIQQFIWQLWSHLTQKPNRIKSWCEDILHPKGRTSTSPRCHNVLPKCSGHRSVPELWNSNLTDAQRHTAVIQVSFDPNYGFHLIYSLLYL